MRLWVALYLMIWVVFLEFLLVMIPVAQALLLPLHAVLGVVILGAAYSNFSALRKTRAPGRLKRVARATFWLTVLMVFLGVLLFFNVGAAWNLPLVSISVYHAVLFIHIVNAFAIITQAAAVAIAYDMWEEHEFDQETEPGVVPGLPSPSPTRGPP